MAMMERFFIIIALADSSHPRNLTLTTYGLTKTGHGRSKDSTSYITVKKADKTKHVTNLDLLTIL